MDAGHAQSKRPLVAAFAGPYGHPFHPLLVAVPIGAWVASFAFDLVALVARDPSSPAFAARWLIGIGVLGACVAACVGFLDLLALPPGTRAKRTAQLHAAINLTVTGLYAGNLAWRLAEPSTGAGWGPVVLSLVGLLGLSAGGWLGGRLAYRYGVRVADEQTQAEGFRPPPGSAADTDRATAGSRRTH